MLEDALNKNLPQISQGDMLPGDNGGNMNGQAVLCWSTESVAYCYLKCKI